MKEILYIYRDIKTSDFIISNKEKKIIPVWLKNEYNNSNFIYDENEEIWKITESFPTESETSIPIEFAELPFKPEKIEFLGNIIFTKRHEIYLEDLSTDEMQLFLNRRDMSKKFSFMKEKIKDKDGISKNYAGAKIYIDYEKLTLKITFVIFSRNSTNEPISPLDEKPVLKEESLSFDMKTGKLSCDFAIMEEFISSKKERKKKYCYSLPYESHYEVLDFFMELETQKLPPFILKVAHDKLCILAKKYTGLSDSLSFQNCVILGENTGKRRYLSEMYFITKLPCEPRLYDVLMNKELYDIKFHFKYNRKNTKVLNRFLRKAHIKNYRVLRKSFSVNPLCLISYMRLHDAGFKDINLFNRVIESEEDIEFINFADRESLVFFCKKCIKNRGEIPTMNILLKKYYDEDGVEDWYEKNDALGMFSMYYQYLPDELKKDIFEDGFTRFNHDALSNISYKIRNKKIVFKYTQNDLKLEDDIDGFSFRLPKDSYQLCEIGTSLHNCVASYADSVEKKDCLIVYAKKDDKYKFCIEVRGNKIFQERTDYNSNPNEEEKVVLQKWHKRHGLQIERIKECNLL